MQIIITGALAIIFAILLAVSESPKHSVSTFSELEVIRSYQTQSVNHVAPAAKRLHQNFVLWLS